MKLQRISCYLFSQSGMKFAKSRPKKESMSNPLFWLLMRLSLLYYNRGYSKLEILPLPKLRFGRLPRKEGRTKALRERQASVLNRKSQSDHSFLSNSCDNISQSQPFTNLVFQDMHEITHLPFSLQSTDRILSLLNKSSESIQYQSFLTALKADSRASMNVLASSSFTIQKIYLPMLII